MICRSLFLSFILILNAVVLNAQTAPLNIQQVSHVPNSSFMVPSDLNDIWGWVDSAGNEYAIVGTNEGTSIFDLSNSSFPHEVLFVHNEC